jgi:hypothetical protein
MKPKDKIKNILIAITICFFIGVAFFYTISKKEAPSTSLLESVSDTTLENTDSGRYNTLDPETASRIYFESYEAMEQYFSDLDKKRERDVAEYNNLTKGTIVEQIQNISIPSYLDGKQLTQLQQGKIYIKEPATEEFPNGISLWAADLEKNKKSFVIDFGAYLEKDINSFVIGDFNNDGLDDVAHIIGYTGGGSGYFYYLTIFINDHGKLKYVTQEEFGDRVFVKKLRYESGLFAIDMITQGEGDDFMGYCCANVPITIKFKLENSKLVEVQ